MDNCEEDLLREFQRICRKSGLKATSPRFVTYKCMRDATEHPVVDQVWEKVKRELPTISRESVYRILNDFASRGVIGALERPDVVARYDCNPERHDHFFCDRCGRVFDFEAPTLPTLAEELAGRFGRVERAEIRARGVCRECLERETKEN